MKDSRLKSETIGIEKWSRDEDIIHIIWPQSIENGAIAVLL